MEVFRKPLTWIREATRVFRASGFKGLLKAYGWRFVALFFVYYLVRDSFLYLLLPWLAAKGLLSLGN